jgi:iron(III) transport system permease protein
MNIERSTYIMGGLLLVLGGLVLYPLFMIFYGSFWSDAPGAPGHFTVQGYIEAYSDPAVLSALGTTFWLAAVRTVVTSVMAIFFAWVLVRTDLPYKGLFEVMLWLPFFLPLMPMTMSWVLLLSPHIGIVNQLLVKLPFIQDAVFNIYSYGGIIWSHLFFSTSVRVIMIVPAFRRMDASLEEAARVSGAGRFGSIVRITIPVLMPGILGATMLGFIKSLESFEIELLLGVPQGIYVYTTKIYQLITSEPARYPPAMALTGVFLVVVFFLIFLYRHLISRREYTTITGRGFTVRPVLLGRWKPFLVILFSLYIFVSTILPLSVLVLGTFMRYFGLFRGDWFTFANWAKVLGDSSLLTSVKNTFILGAGVAIGGVLLYLLVSYIIIRTRARGRGALDFVSWLPWSVPGLVLALGMLWAYVGGIPLPFVLYGTIWIMMLAIVVAQMPFGMRIMNASMLQVSKELEESARVHGASWAYTMRRIMMPLLGPALMAIALILFQAAVRDLATVVLLYSPKSRVLSTLMLDYWLGGAQESGAVIGLMIVVLAILGAIAARVLGRRGEILT